MAAHKTTSKSVKNRFDAIQTKSKKTSFDVGSVEEFMRRPNGDVARSALHSMTAVEEFFNRVHSKADGKFATSGTGGGHYGGRGAGKKETSAQKHQPGGTGHAPPPPKSSGKAEAPSEFQKSAASLEKRVNEPRKLSDFKKKAEAPKAKAEAPKAESNKTESPVERISRERDARKAAYKEAHKDDHLKAKPENPDDKFQRQIDDIHKVKDALATKPKGFDPPKVGTAAKTSAPIKSTVKSGDKVKGFLSKVGKAARSISDNNMTGRQKQMQDQAHGGTAKHLSTREALMTGRDYKQYQQRHG